MGPGGEKTHFTIGEVARIFGLTVQTLHYWLKSGRIRRHERTSSRGNYRIPREELVRLLADAGREVPGLWERRRRKVLVIDDDPGVRKFALAAARSPRMPLSLRTAASVEDGLLLAAQFRPEVILLDTTLPKDRLRAAQGLAFIRGTKLLRKARVIAMTPDPRIGQGMVRSGADGVLLKPFSLADFRAAVTAKQAGNAKAAIRRVDVNVCSEGEQAPAPPARR
jgi:excisionase family DNA binding protein